MYEDFIKSKLTIGNNEYDILEGELFQYNLKFYVDNPRVYSTLRISNADSMPSQDEIEHLMCEMEHVKQLRISIESNGGLIDPLIVRDGDMVVLEGNSRLAAYRLLAKINSKWAKVKCKILPKGIDESAIFTLLGQYHIIGRKDWSPFEQAGYLYRRQKNTKYHANEMAKELGITTSKAKNYIKVYTYMIDHDDLIPEKWSYYEEFLKSKPIMCAIEKNPELEIVLVEQIKTNQILAAADVRKVGEIVSVDSKKSKKAVQQIISGEVDIYTVYEEIKDSGDLDEIVKKLKKFRDYIMEDSFETNIVNGKNPEVKYLIEKISKRFKEIDKKC